MKGKRQERKGDGKTVGGKESVKEGGWGVGSGKGRDKDEGGGRRRQE